MNNYVGALGLKIPISRPCTVLMLMVSTGTARDMALIGER